VKGIRVLVVDDQPLVRTGLRTVLSTAAGIVPAGEAPNGLAAVRAVATHRPDVVLMDINMPGMNGLQATREICRTSRSKVIMLSMFDHDEFLFESLRAGASGFILKEAPPESMVQAVREVAAGESLLSPSLTRRLLAEFARRPVPVPAGAAGSPGGRLTERERDVFRLLVRGNSNEEIARELSVGASTVKSHIQHLYQKLGVRDRVQMVIYAYENGLV
jgi:DNA-binding NarL/FixJ family response regulator